jgi:hypothetical protein
MPNSVHFWSEIPDDIRLAGRLDAEKHANHDALGKFDGVTQLTSLVQMHSVFRTVLSNNYAFDDADFHTHGSPGAIYIGDDVFTFGKALEPFANQGFEKIFKANGTIDFNGCHVGAGWEGEYFLTEIGRIFLKAGGGTVVGSTGYGAADIWITGHVGHPFGSRVTARVTPGGAVTLSGHSNLIPSVINERFQKAVLYVDDLERRQTKYDLKQARNCLAWANVYIAPPANGSWGTLSNACNYLDKAENELKAAEKVTR